MVNSFLIMLMIHMTSKINPLTDTVQRRTVIAVPATLDAIECYFYFAKTQGSGDVEIRIVVWMEVSQGRVAGAMYSPVRLSFVNINGLLESSESLTPPRKTSLLRRESMYRGG